MNKIPVGQTIAKSFSFVFENYLSVLGVLWLPMVIQGVAGYFLMAPLFKGFLAAGPSVDPQSAAIQMFALMPRLFLFDIIAIALLAMMSVGITREALGVRTGPRYVYYSFGAADLRVLGGYVLAYVICLALMFVVTIVASIASLAVVGVAASGKAAPALAILVQAAMIFAVELAALYIWVRLTSFSTAVAVAESQFGLWRSWQLTRGNFWRLFVIILVVTIPIFVMEMVVAGFIAGPIIAKLVMIDPKNPQAVFAAVSAMMSQWMPYFAYYWFAWIVLSPIVFGLLVAPAAFAYRSLVRDTTAAEAF